MEQEQTLRDLLEEIPAPPSTVTIDWVLPAGRRARRRRRAVWAAGTSVALTLGALVATPALLRGSAAPVLPATPSLPPARPPADCHDVKLAQTGMSGLDPVAVDPSGRYIVGNSTVGGRSRPVLWTDGRPKGLGYRNDSTRATDVNSAGTVVGVSGDEIVQIPPGDAGALKVFDAGAPTSDPVINAAGDVLFSVTPAVDRTIAMIWRAGEPEAHPLPLPTGALAEDLADDGTIVGAVDKVAYIWAAGGPGRALPTPAGAKTVAHAVRGDWVVGSIALPGRATTTALWNLSTGALTEIPGEFHSGIAVNTSGWFVDNWHDLDTGTTDGADAAPAGDPHAEMADLSDTGLVVGTLPDGPHAWQC
ncbi:hypothetical protein [Actinoplanes sp. HUAS TT8]|uniref:hypothetical protein n=1 Tax=Actinoplanes sp. HUAS TT8 TaxID=3447453 RepID=UPI003F51E3A9